MISNLDTSNLLLTSKSIQQGYPPKRVAAVPREASSIVIVAVVIVVVVVAAIIIVVVLVIPNGDLEGLWVILSFHDMCFPLQCEYRF